MIYPKYAYRFIDAVWEFVPGGDSLRETILCAAKDSSNYQGRLIRVEKAGKNKVMLSGFLQVGMVRPLEELNFRRPYPLLEAMSDSIGEVTDAHSMLFSDVGREHEQEFLETMSKAFWSCAKNFADPGFMVAHIHDLHLHRKIFDLN